MVETRRDYEAHSYKKMAIRVILLAILVLAVLVIPKTVDRLHTADHEHTEAALIRACSERPENVLNIFINSSLERLNCIIQLPDGRVGDLVLQPCKRGIIEVTAYILGGGTFEETILALTQKGCIKVW